MIALLRELSNIRISRLNLRKQKKECGQKH